MKSKKATIDLNKADIQPIPPLFNNTSLVSLTQQLNGLIDRYKTLYELYDKMLTVNCPAGRIITVIENIENAINALCLRISTYQGILTIKE